MRWKCLRIVVCGVAMGSAVGMAAEAPGTPVPSLGNMHIPTVDSAHIPYNSDPPTSGPHVPFVARWGAYRQPIPPEVQVHNLEDGGILIQYNCPMGCPDLTAKVERLAADYVGKTPAEKYHRLLVAPYQGMKTAIALTAWGRIDQFDQFDEARIGRFIEAYIGIDHHPAKK